ncbi:MAG: ABC transporter ATP-binding protein [Opitutaceae bacterium]|nr:ABC transporter ATP-binding protein [Opitutaceae bacterium]
MVATEKAAPSGPIMELSAVTKRFGKFTAVDRVELAVREGEFFTLVGPSGSGKTTLLRMLVGMEKPTSGEIRLRGAVINDVPPNQRPTCMVFQSLALFPHMTVGQNVEFPLRVRNVSSGDRRTTAWELLKLLHLKPETYYDKLVTKCSGGERQRVALARALAFDPQILFFDEPLSAIDARLRKILQKELKDIQRKTGKTFVYVTHSLEEAMLMSDRVAILRGGRLEQVGTPDEIYSRPNSAFVAEFMGEVNLLPVVANADARLSFAGGKWTFAAPEPLGAGTERTLMVRPESIRFLHDGQLAPNMLPGRVLNEFSLGSRVQYHVEVRSGTVLTVERLREERWLGGPEVAVGWDTKDSLLLDK